MGYGVLLMRWRGMAMMSIQEIRETRDEVVRE